MIKFKRYVLKATLISLYYSLIYPYLTYACTRLYTLFQTCKIIYWPPFWNKVYGETIIILHCLKS